jgi:thiopurine S-methyltransferase
LLPKLVSSTPQQCVVFPLCGKTLDMKAVLDMGHQVIGIEGSQNGIEEFFNENNIPYEVEKDESNQYQIYKVDKNNKSYY